MDLKLNRFLVAGHVTLRGTAANALLAPRFPDFLDFNRIYFVPVTTEPGSLDVPQRRSLTHPVKGRVMPGDTFCVSAAARHASSGHGDPSAVIGTRNCIRFSGATWAYLRRALGFRSGSYVVNFSPNQYFAQNSLTGCGTSTRPGTSRAVIIRCRPYTCDTTPSTTPTFAFEQHFVGSARVRDSSWPTR